MLSYVLMQHLTQSATAESKMLTDKQTP